MKNSTQEAHSMTKDIDLDALQAAVDASSEIGAFVIQNSDLRALITRLRKAEAVREGWKLMPIVSTQKMRDAFDDAHLRACFREESYAALVDAAPDSTPTDSAEDQARPK